MTATEIKKQIKEYMRMNGVGLKVTNISVTVAEYDDEEIFATVWDVNVNTWMHDKWFNEEFQCFTFTVEDEKTAVTKAKRIATTLGNTFNKVAYNGIENC